MESDFLWYRLDMQSGGKDWEVGERGCSTLLLSVSMILRARSASSLRDLPEPELELDLEALGLNDREIPPDKITKLEKIGSGGFKDVYIGKWGKRKVAISEFREQLTESKSRWCCF